MVNLDIYTAMKENNITQKRVAEQLHMKEPNFSTLLKTELVGKKAGTRLLILAIIKRLAAEDLRKSESAEGVIE